MNISIATMLPVQMVPLVVFHLASAEPDSANNFISLASLKMSHFLFIKDLIDIA